MLVAFRALCLYDACFSNERKNMNEQSKDRDQAVSSGSQGDVVFLLKKLQEQLTFLERKVDILIEQSKQKPAFNKERSFSKPAFRSTGSSYGDSRYASRPDSRSERRGPPRERSYESGNRSSERSYGNSDSRGFAGKKKPFFAKKRER